MKTFCSSTAFFLFFFASQIVFCQKTIHVFVALCDNENQGIVPVPANLGQGDAPSGNLYWGAAYGVKNFLKAKTSDWEFVRFVESTHYTVLERVLFKHKTDGVFLLADAYDGRYIKNCIRDFLASSNSQEGFGLVEGGQKMQFGGGADLLAYVGHDGLMEFEVEVEFQNEKPGKPVIILACYSRDYFKSYIEAAQADPLLWTTHLMAPEAYTLKAAVDGWLKNETPAEIEERAAQAYHQYQKCGIRGARNLFATGF